MNDENPYEPPKSPDPIPNSEKKRKLSLLLKLGLWLLAACIVVWAVGFCLTMFTMTNTLNTLVNAPTEKATPDLGPLFTLTLMFNSIGSILGGLGLVCIILAAIRNIFLKG